MTGIVLNVFSKASNQVETFKDCSPDTSLLELRTKMLIGNDPKPFDLFKPRNPIPLTTYKQVTDAVASLGNLTDTCNAFILGCSVGDLFPLASHNNRHLHLIVAGRPVTLNVFLRASVKIRVLRGCSLDASLFELMTKILKGRNPAQFKFYKPRESILAESDRAAKFVSLEASDEIDLDDSLQDLFPESCDKRYVHIIAEDCPFTLNIFLKASNQVETLEGCPPNAPLSDLIPRLLKDLDTNPEPRQFEFFKPRDPIPLTTSARVAAAVASLSNLTYSTLTPGFLIRDLFPLASRDDRHVHAIVADHTITLHIFNIYTRKLKSLKDCSPDVSLLEAMTRLFQEFNLGLEPKYELLKPREPILSTTDERVAGIVAKLGNLRKACDEFTLHHSVRDLFRAAPYDKTQVHLILY